MSNTYTQIHIQCVFAVKFRKAMIDKSFQERLHQYISGIVSGEGHKLIAINSMPDHLHLFFGMRPNQSLSDLMRHVKGESSEWINKQKFTSAKFNWQEGYGAFSYAKSQVDVVVKYILNQELHHKKKTFLEEYREFLRKFEVDYREEHLFTAPE
jgi:REP element-mobilizing transposase RayT